MKRDRTEGDFPAWQVAASEHGLALLEAILHGKSDENQHAPLFEYGDGTMCLTPDATRPGWTIFRLWGQPYNPMATDDVQEKYRVVWELEFPPAADFEAKASQLLAPYKPGGPIPMPVTYDTTGKSIVQVMVDVAQWIVANGRNHPDAAKLADLFDDPLDRDIIANMLTRHGPGLRSEHIKRCQELGDIHGRIPGMVDRPITSGAVNLHTEAARESLVRYLWAMYGEDRVAGFVTVKVNDLSYGRLYATTGKYNKEEETDSRITVVPAKWGTGPAFSMEAAPKSLVRMCRLILRRYIESPEILHDEEGKTGLDAHWTSYIKAFHARCPDIVCAIRDTDFLTNGVGAVMHVMGMHWDHTRHLGVQVDPRGFKEALRTMQVDLDAEESMQFKREGKWFAIPCPVRDKETSFAVQDALQWLIDIGDDMDMSHVPDMKTSYERGFIARPKKKARDAWKDSVHRQALLAWASTRGENVRETLLQAFKLTEEGEHGDDWGV